MQANWLPTAFTKPLSEDFVSDGPKLRQFVSLFWRSKETKPGEAFVLDPWQAWLIDRILERYPADWPVEALRGRLRYEQCVICLGRQNGKTVLAAILSLYGLLMHVQGPTVLGLAESNAQAALVYNTAKFVIDNTKLSKGFVSTSTRGLRSVDGTRTYRTAPAKADALQGITISLCLYDEVHLTPPEMWAAVQLGTGAIPDGMVLGITTAGDDRSVLLKSLYASGAKAVAGDPGLERFGWFLWEAPEGAAIDDPAAIMAANPAVACGRKDLDKTLNAVRTMPEHQARQFVHNRFVAASGAWLPTYQWSALPEGYLPGKPTHVAVSVSQGWEWASVVLSSKEEDSIHTEVFCQVEKPDLDSLAKLCEGISRQARVTFVMEGTLRNLAERLRKRGLQVEFFNLAQMASAAQTTYAKVQRQEVTHDHLPIVADQISRGVWKKVGDASRIVPAGTGDIDLLLAQIMAIHAAEVYLKPGLGVY